MKIEDRLRETAGIDSSNRLLLAQWIFDKELLSKSMQAISIEFPHYSLHDSSHSSSIVSEIEKILGDSVSKLSFIDCWLILESAYWHDMGMVVPSEKKEELLNSAIFKEFIRHQASQLTDLTQYATLVKKYNEGEIVGCFTDLELAHKYLIAEFVRRGHHLGSKLNVINPENISVMTPRTGLVSSRYFSIIGKIVEMHGLPFESIFELAQEDDGLTAEDNSHPRFVACLIRLGDLLDIDDNRHNETILKCLKHIPKTSKDHYKKHKSIEEKLVNNKFIAIKAKCFDIETFEIQSKWFEWIEKEIEVQDKHWGEIAPEKLVHKLPTIKYLNCELEGCINVGVTRLSIDITQAYKYLAGQYLYKNKINSINEILQNSVDAILDRVWDECKDSSINRERLKKIVVDKHKIEVTVNTVSEDNGDRCYLVKVSDTGKGMNYEEVKILTEVASVNRRMYKDKRRNGMPEWMKPSGYFGIGLQSIFALTDKFVITTRNSSEYEYEISLEKIGDSLPTFTLKKNSIISWSFGTVISFEIQDNVLPKTYSIGGVVDQNVRDYDPVANEAMNFGLWKLEEVVSNFAKHNEIPIYFNGENVSGNYEEFSVFDSKNGIEYDVNFDIQSRICEWSYRNRVTKFDKSISMINVTGNVIAGNANEFISLDRQSFHDEGMDKVLDRLKISLVENKDRIYSISSIKNIASLYYYLIDSRINDEWKSVELSGKKLSDILNVGEIILIAPEATDNIVILNSNREIIKGNHNEFYLLVNVLSHEGFGISIESVEYLDCKQTHFHAESKIELYTIKIVANPSQSKIDSSVLKHWVGKEKSSSRSRYWIPCTDDEFSEIIVDVNKMRNLTLPFIPFSGLFIKGIVLPSTRKKFEDDLPILVDFICDINGHKQRSKIETVYRDFQNKYPFEFRSERRY